MGLDPKQLVAGPYLNPGLTFVSSNGPTKLHMLPSAHHMLDGKLATIVTLFHVAGVDKLLYSVT